MTLESAASITPAPAVEQSVAEKVRRASPVLGWTMVAGGSLFFAALGADLHFHGRLQQWDQPIHQAVYQHTGALLIVIGSAISLLGQLTLVVPATIAVAYYLFKKKQRRALAGWLSAMIGSAILDQIFKSIFQIPRPTHFTTYVFKKDEGGFSFPSGHTMSVAIFCGALVIVIMYLNALPIRRRVLLGILTAGMGILEACGLMLIGVHYLTDVLGGLALSLAWLGVIRLLLPAKLPVKLEARV